MSDQEGIPRLANEFQCRPPMDYNNHLQMVQGCMDRLGVDVEAAWLYGVTGWAFMINIPRGVCCSGPSAWEWYRICERTPSIGVDTSEYVLSHKDDEDFGERKKEAIAFTKARHDAGVPLYGAEFGYPEWYMVSATDERGLKYVYTNGLERTYCTTFRTWEDFGTVDVGILFVGAVRRSEGTADDHRALADALDFALAVGHASPGYLGGEHVGLRAYESWITGLSDGSLADGPWNHPDGTTYNGGFWHDCRVRAEQFLRLCPERLSGRLEPEFTRAADEYGQVAEGLAQVHALFPYGMSSDLPSPELVAQASEHLRTAQEAENRGLDMLASIRKIL